MKVSYPHLVNFFKEKPSIEDVSEKLFQLGHENEIIDNILDIEFTPNRGDCLSLLGLARDLSVFFALDTSPAYYKENFEALDLNFQNHSPEDCPAISFLSINIDEIPSKYEDYLESYFTTFQINKNNFFTDISNYLAYEMGQPTHCYDINKLDSGIEFVSENLNENFETVIDKKIALSGNNCVFKSNNEVVNLAGVMGGKSTACNKSTKKVLIECAYFNPESIIGKALKYNLHSDASYKFERGVDPSYQEQILRRFIQIVSDHTNIESIKHSSFVSKELPVKTLKFDVKEIETIIGTNIDEELYKNSIIKLGFNISNNHIIVPSYRHDIAHQNDMAEEMARIIGYDNIKSAEFKINKTHVSADSEPENFLRNFLASKGFNEVINMPFTTNTDASIKIDNPLDSNRACLRTTLKDSLIENLLYNEKRQNESIKLFEISDIYSITKDSEIKNEKYLGIVVSGRVGNNYKEFSKKLDHQYLEEHCGLDKNSIFEISRDGLDTKIKNKIYMALIKFSNLPKSLENLQNIKVNKINFNTYKPISDFPSSTRDLSFVLSDQNKIKELEEIILNFKSSFLKDSFVFDFYNNEKTNQIKIGFRLIFNSNSRTLTVDDVDNEIDDIVTMCMEIGGVDIPGYK